MNLSSSPMNAATQTSRPAVNVSSKGTKRHPAYVSSRQQSKIFSSVPHRNWIAVFQFPPGTTNPSLSSNRARLTLGPSSVGALFYKKSPLTPQTADVASKAQSVAPKGQSVAPLAEVGR